VIDGLETASVRKKLRTGHSAHGDRDDVYRGAAELGVDLDATSLRRGRAASVAPEVGRARA